VVVAVSAVNTWTPVLDPRVPLGAPVVGALIGLLSGTYPSLRAASLEPVAPIAKLTVQPADFPLPIRGHDFAIQQKRIEADPGGFPWILDDEV